MPRRPADIDLLPAPRIVLIRRPGLPLTPAAEFFCDVLARARPADARGVAAGKDARAQSFSRTAA